MRNIIAVMLAVLGIGVVDGHAQSESSARRVGILSAYARPSGMSPLVARLRELGWVEHQNLVLDGRYADGATERLPALAADLVRANAEVIVAVTNLEIAAARSATRTTPIVMVAAGDPVALGFIASLARPGGNVTGAAYHTPEVSGKMIELLKLALPSATRLAVLWNPTYPAVQNHAREVDAAARAHGVTLELVALERGANLEVAFERLRRLRPAALYVAPDPLTLTRVREIVQFGEREKLPIVSVHRAFADQGGFMTYAAHLGELNRLAASYVDRILRGAKPADLPVEQPSRFELVINLKAARALGLAIPPSLLVRADEVLE